MKRILTALLLSAFAGNASAVLISDVGSYDSLVAQDTLPNSGNEEDWIEGLLLADVTYTQLSGSGGNSAWEAVTGVGSVAGDYAFDFGAGINPSHFLVKLGGGQGTGVSDTHFLFENLLSLQWAFVNLSDFGDVKLDNVGVISHVGTVDGGGTVTVSEPGTLALLGGSLIGFGLLRRRKRVQ